MARLSVVEKPVAGPFARLVGDYLQERRASGASGKTIRIYADALEGVLLPFCAEAGVTEVAGLTSRHLNDLSVGLLDGSRSRSGRPLAKPTVSSYMRAVNTFTAWARGAGEAVEAKAQLPRTPKRVIDTLSRDEIRRMEDAAEDERDRLIVRILADTGIRLGELRGIHVDDLRYEGKRHYLKVLGKGDRERLVPISPALAQRITRYVQRTRREAASDLIFLSRRRRPRTGAYEPLTESGAEQVIATLAEAAGIKKRVYPHLFRHSFITEQLRQGINPILLARLVGHTSLTMIQEVYEHLTSDDDHGLLMRSLLASDAKR